MKRIIITVAVLALIVVGPAMGQEPPVSVQAGAIFQHNAPTVFGYSLAGNINLYRITDAEGNVKAQFFNRPLAIVTDDVYEIDGRDQIESGAMLIGAKAFVGNFSLGGAVGLGLDVESGENDPISPAMIEFGWQPLEYAGLTLNGTYIPIGNQVADIVFVSGGISINPGAIF